MFLALFGSILLQPPAAEARDFAVDRQDDAPAASACEDGIENDCSLRGAIAVANGLAEASTITIPAGHYILSASSFCRFQPSADPFAVFTSTGPALCLSRDIALIGAGAADTILDANEPAGATGASHPVFLVSWGLVTSMEGLTITKGNWTAGSIFLTPGGGISNAGTLTLTDVAVTDNYGRTAGGIANRGTLTLRRCQITRNTGSDGAGVRNEQGGTVTAFDTEASFNTASNSGGAFNNAGGTMTIVNSTLHDNVARNGGAVSTSLFNTTSLINSTISGNQAFDGGGIASSGTMTLRSCTVTANTAQWTTDPGRGSGGGIDSSGSLTASNTVFAGNASPTGRPDCNAFLNSEGHNLIGNTNGCAISGPGTGDVTGVSAQLGALAFNGGTTPTHVPQPGSPAIGAGDPATPGSGAPACPAADQRGLLRPGGTSCDIGAVEVSEVFGLSRVLPGRGGIGGTVLLHVAGNGFAPGATVRLERAGQAPIDGAPVQVEAGRSSVTASVDLAGATEGAWDVVVTNPGGVSERLDAAFLVEAPRAPDVWLQVLGPRALRPGVPTLFTLVYGNRGNVDALGVPLTLSVAEGMSYRLLFPVGPPPLRDPEIELDWSFQAMEVDLGAAGGGTANLTFLLPVVPAGSTSGLQFLLTLPPTLPHGGTVTSFASIGLPLMTPQLTDATVNAMVDGARAYIESLIDVTVPDTLVPALALQARAQLDAVADEGRSLLVQTGGAAQQVHSLAWLQIELALRAAKASLPEQLAWSASSWSTQLLAQLATGLRPGVAQAQSPSGPVCPIVPCGGGSVLTEGCGCTDLTCDKPGCGFPPPIPDPPGCNLGGRMTLGDFLTKLGKCRMPKDLCESLPNHRVVTNDDGSMFCVPNDPGRHCPAITIPNPLGAGSLDCLGTPIRNSHDPNDKTGVTGVGEGHFLLPGTPLAYTVRFENDPELASAAAQVVTITDQLDPAQVDLSSFALGPITFGSIIVPVPAGAQKFSGGVDLRPAQNLLVTIQAAIDLTTGFVYWTFTSVDPATMQLTTDPDAGFLPVNANAPEGEGSVSFTVLPRSDLTTGTTICNGASIIFDVNAPIITPTWCNGFDETPPESAVAPLPATQAGSDVALTWSGTDAGVGIAAYSIYVSTNGGPFTAFLTDTTDTAATFTGTPGATYAFYSVAQDGLGNREAAPLVGDAQTTIGAGGGARDLAITSVKVPSTVKLTAKKPSRSIVVTVRVQNRGTREERIPTIDALATLVDLQIESLGTCAPPTTTLRVPGSLRRKPLVLKPKRSMSVRFDIPVDCANDPAKSPKGASSAHDYGFVARLGAFGGADAYQLDDVCPRPALGSGSVTRPAGTFPERGCGAPLGGKTFGGPVLTDVVGTGAVAP